MAHKVEMGDDSPVFSFQISPMKLGLTYFLWLYPENLRKESILVKIKLLLKMKLYQETRSKRVGVLEKMYFFCIALLQAYSTIKCYILRFS